MTVQLSIVSKPKSNTFHPGLVPQSVDVEEVQRRVASYRIQAASNRPANLGVPKLPVGQLDRINPYQLTPAEYKTGLMGLYNRFLLKSGGIPKADPFLFYQNMLMACFLEASGLGNQYKASPFTEGRKKQFNPERLALLGAWQLLATPAMTSRVKVRKDVSTRSFVVEVPICAVNVMLLQCGMQVFTSYGDEVKLALKNNLVPPSLPHIGPPPDEEALKKARPKGKLEVEEGDEEGGEENGEEGDQAPMEGGESSPSSDAGTELNVFSEEDVSFLRSRRFNIQAIAKHANPNMPVKVLREAVNFIEEVYFVPNGTALVMMMRIRVDEKLSQAITCTPFNEIAPYDVHAFFRNWVSSLYGLRVKQAPRYVAPLGLIKKKMPPGEDLRINKEGIAVDAVGTFYMVPHHLDNLREYETRINEHLRNPDGSYSEADEDGGIKRTAPVSMAVFVDWVNKKFTYTNTVGNTAVLDMDRFQPAQPRHYARWFSTRLNKASGQLSLLINFLRGIDSSVPPVLTYVQLESEVLYFVKQSTGVVPQADTLTVGEIFTTEQEDGTVGVPAGLLLVEACKRVTNRLNADPNLAYAAHGVSTSLTMRALAHIIATYGSDLDGLRSIDRESRSKYINQGLDPNYEPEALPYVKDDAKSPMSVLPHQAKVLNLSRTSPDFMLWGVAAGGGKTPLSVLNYLKEMKEGHCKRILVLAPKALVSTHIREITTFTSGRVNIIPVTNYTAKWLGYEALGRMIDSSPINTVVISYFDMLGAYKQVSYGPYSTPVYTVAEWLRQFNWDYCVIDEIHQLRNPSKKQAGVHRLISGIKKIRGMSGTLVANQLQDLAPQVALLDPTLFGSQEDFKKEYAEEIKGNKVTKWFEGAQSQVLERIKSNVGFIQINRREWAALLPEMKESFYVVDLTPAQAAVYKTILTEAMDSIEKDPKLKGKLDKWMKKAREEEESHEDDLANSVENSESFAAVQSILKPYLARLERFVSAPYKEPAGATLLEDADKVSPKIVKVGELCTKHIEQGIKGKIIIFTNYNWSAEDCATYLDSLPALRGKVLYYEATQAEQHRARFENDPNLMVMCGTGNTLSTGLNLQYASRLIRIETVWTPGEYEQGNSRINRPNVQQKETRSTVYIDTIVANNTIDVTKCAYLMSKVITAEKFYNSGDPKYDELESPGLFTMTLENIFNMSNLVTLKEYYDAFKEYKEVQVADYADYKAKHPELTFTKVPRAGNLPDSTLMRHTPYDPGTELYGADKLGLIRYDKYMGLNEEDLIDDEGDDAEDLSTKEISAAETEKVRGLVVHTDAGEGELHRAGRFRLQIRLYSTGEIIVRSKLATFVVTRQTTNSKDMRVLLAKQNPDIPLEEGEEPEVPAKLPDRVKRKLKGEEPETKESLAFELSFIVINGMLGVSLDNAEDEAVANAARQFGFSNPPSFVYAQLRSFKQFNALIQTWRNAELKMPYENSSELKAMFEHMRKFGVRGVDLFDFARRNDFRMFLRMQFKPEGRLDLIKPFPYIFEDKYHVALPFAGQAGTKVALQNSRKITKLGVAAPTWKKVLVDQVMYKFVGNKAEASETIKDILKSGILISNVEELKEQFKELRFRKDRAS